MLQGALVEQDRAGVRPTRHGPLSPSLPQYTLSLLLNCLLLAELEAHAQGKGNKAESAHHDRVRELHVV